MPQASTRNISSGLLIIRPWVVVTVLCLFYCLMVMVVNEGDPLALVTIGTRFSEGLTDGTEGYDGQFVYFIARDPSTAAIFIENGGDFAAYRFQRILLPFLGMVLSLGQDALIPWALLAVNLAALAVGTALLEHLLVCHGVSRWYALGLALSIGMMGTVRLSLPETLAYALVLAGIVAFPDSLHNPGRYIPIWVSAIFFALAALAKETTLLFVAGYGLYLLYQRRVRDAFILGLVAGLPFFIWQLVLYDRFGTFGIGSGGAMTTGFEIIPFGGVIRILTESVPDMQPATLPFGDLLYTTGDPAISTASIMIFVIFLLLLGPFVLIPTIWGLYTSWKSIRRGCFNIYVMLLLVNAGIMLFVPFSTYREPLGIFRFIIGLQIAVILYGAHVKSQRVLLNSTIWVLTMLFLLGSDFAQ